MKSINIITMGCSKNLVDSEHLAAQLTEAGYQVVFDDEALEHNILIINTCGFIGDAKQESIEMILAAVEAKEEGFVEQLYVVGCLSERYADELRNEIPDVDKYFGCPIWSELMQDLGTEHRQDLETTRQISTPQHYAYLKISEGCNWGCSYCAIPLIRGRHISVPIEDLMAEARGLVAGGVSEIILVAQDTTYYGLDLYGERRLAQLMRELCTIEGLKWLRLQYAYPADFPRDVIEVMASEDKICKYLDIPIQHCADSQLQAMRRRHTKAELQQLISDLRQAMPEIALRTTLIVGFPNESDDDFEQLCDFVKDVKFERLGAFEYSEEEGTSAARKFQDNVPQEIKKQRAERIMAIQSEISYQRNLSLIGREIEVVIDAAEGEYFRARSQWDSPEVDVEVLIARNERPNDHYAIGSHHRILISDATEFDLISDTKNLI